jgi:hypothetical protein
VLYNTIRIEVATAKDIPESINVVDGTNNNDFNKLKYGDITKTNNKCM